LKFPSQHLEFQRLWVETQLLLTTVPDVEVSDTTGDAICSTADQKIKAAQN